MGGGSRREEGGSGGAQTGRSGEEERRVVLGSRRFHVEEEGKRLRKAASSFTSEAGFICLPENKMCTPCCVSQVRNNCPRASVV